jgi:type III restriction enzyme
MMNGTANHVNNRLSLRPPQSESLEILSILCDELNLNKGRELTAELKKVTARHPTCSDFERSFPSICFALATGVGKTRLMGAFITYLYLVKKIRNFFVLAPNLTVYNKLIDDLGNPSCPKYVFKGIGELSIQRPTVITGDNYTDKAQAGLFDSGVHINIFNISKINAETRGGRTPRIKRMSEYLGKAYFDYLAGLDDLVLLMDESHHYRAERGMDVINELNPILGLELTATPQVEKGGNSVKFKNVVYEYSLSKAIRDGFVKEPAVGTRKNFDPGQYSLEELDRIKLEDGIRIHQDTKLALEIYSRDTSAKAVKPFVLVVAKDTEHASGLMKLIQSDSFFDGHYAKRVMEIHSNQSGTERDENIQQLLSVEDPSNPIEIVIHVNMLKEGWDVTNLYTIIPLRAAASQTLREQTIGRGLRLPYGERTGVDKVDKLTIVAHDRFQEIVDEANRPDSIIRQENIIVIDLEELSHPKEVVTSKSTLSQKTEEEQNDVIAIATPEEKQQAQNACDARAIIRNILPEMSPVVRNATDLTRQEAAAIALAKVEERVRSASQASLFADEIIDAARKQYFDVAIEFTQNIIEIPRITIQEAGETRSGFHAFDLDVNGLQFQPVAEEILVRKLREQENDVDTIVGKGHIVTDRLENVIVNELMNLPEVNYDRQADMLFALAGQALDKFRSYLTSEDDVINVVQYNKATIAGFIHSQLMDHFYVEASAFEAPRVLPFSAIQEHNLSKCTQDSLYPYRETITPTSAIPSKVFTGFRKACHTMYKFNSKTEKDFSIILEDDGSVKKWMRPAQGQFQIYYHHNSRQYHPDFVAETGNHIYLIETKKEGEVETPEVQEKSRAAREFCRIASDYTTKNNGKPWRYVLIPHNAVQVNMGFEHLTSRYVEA